MKQHLDLTYRGLAYCDDCGRLLEPEARLYGLCAQCEGAGPPGGGMMTDLPQLPPGLIAVAFPRRGLLLLTVAEFRRAREAGAHGGEIPPGLVPVRFGRHPLLLSGPAFARGLRRAAHWRDLLRAIRREAKAQRSATAPPGQSGTVNAA